MANPTQVSVGSIAAPGKDLADSFFKAGAMYQSFHGSQRAIAEQNMKIDEENRQRGIRRFLADYDPSQAIGKDGFGLSSQALQLQKDRENALRANYQKMAEQGDPNATEENLAADIAALGRPLATAESVESHVFADLVSKNVDRELALSRAKAEGQKYVSMKELVEREKNRVAAINEAQGKRQQLIGTGLQADVSERNAYISGLTGLSAGRYSGGTTGSTKTTTANESSPEFDPSSDKSYALFERDMKDHLPLIGRTSKAFTNIQNAYTTYSSSVDLDNRNLEDAAAREGKPFVRIPKASVSEFWNIYKDDSGTSYFNNLSKNPNDFKPVEVAARLRDRLDMAAMNREKELLRSARGGTVGGGSIVSPGDLPAPRQRVSYDEFRGALGYTPETERSQYELLAEYNNAAYQQLRFSNVVSSTPASPEKLEEAGRVAEAIKNTTQQGSKGGEGTVNRDDVLGNDKIPEKTGTEEKTGTVQQDSDVTGYGIQKTGRTYTQAEIALMDPKQRAEALANNVANEETLTNAFNNSADNRAFKAGLNQLDTASRDLAGANAVKYLSNQSQFNVNSDIELSVTGRRQNDRTVAEENAKKGYNEEVARIERGLSRLGFSDKEVAELRKTVPGLQFDSADDFVRSKVAEFNKGRTTDTRSTLLGGGLEAVKNAAQEEDARKTEDRSFVVNTLQEKLQAELALLTDINKQVDTATIRSNYEKLRKEASDGLRELGYTHSEIIDILAPTGVYNTPDSFIRRGMQIRQQNVAENNARLQQQRDTEASK